VCDGRSLWFGQLDIATEGDSIYKGEAMRYGDELKGKGKQVAGTAKEKVGRLTGDPDLQDRGSAERVEGKVQEKIGKARRKVGEAIEDVGNKIASKR
jgi:uncharacterized protein YjbJ (UPF0337 family)